MRKKVLAIAGPKSFRLDAIVRPAVIGGLLVTDWLSEQADAMTAAIEAVNPDTAEREIDGQLNSDATAALGIFRLERAGDRRLWELAIHESSHAVVAVALGLTVRSVVIRADGTGRCDNEGHDGDFAGRLNCIIAQLAGYLAEHYENPNALSAGRLWGKFDILSARRELDRLNEDFPAWPVPFRAASQLAASIVFHQWPAIFRTAIALRKRTWLDGAEVAGLVGETGWI